MANLAHFLRGLLLPLAIATLLYLSTTHLLLPFIRRHRTTYTSYLPLSPSTDPTTWRTTLSNALYTLFTPASWTRQPPRHPLDPDSEDDSEDDFDAEDGEGMVGFAPVEAQGRRAGEAGTRGAVGAEWEVEGRRLGRDLEEGFRDESSEDGEDEQVEGEGEHAQRSSTRRGDETRRGLSRGRA